MAEFCKQCAEKYGFGFNEAQWYGERYLSVEDEKKGKGIAFLCEGCGPTLVNRSGECISNCIHHHSLNKSPDDPSLSLSE